MAARAVAQARGSEYDELKARFAERMLDDVYAHVPRARGNVAYYELSTPLSTTEFAGYQHGEIYGIEHSPQRFAQTWIKPRTPIGGLYLTGQDVLFCGVGSALMSGVLTAASVLGPSLLRQAPAHHRLRSSLTTWWSRREFEREPDGTGRRLMPVPSSKGGTKEVHHAEHSQFHR